MLGFKLIYVSKRGPRHQVNVKLKTLQELNPIAMDLEY